jgi:hypothetical protein
VATLYSEAEDALETKGVAWSVDDPELRLEIKQKYSQLLSQETAKQVAPIADWLEKRGSKAEQYPGVPALVLRKVILLSTS